MKVLAGQQFVLSASKHNGKRRKRRESAVAPSQKRSPGQRGKTGRVLTWRNVSGRFRACMKMFSQRADTSVAS